MGEGRLLLEQRTFDPVTGVAQSTQTLIDGTGARETRTFSVRVYTATELLRMLERAGLFRRQGLRLVRGRAVHDIDAARHRRDEAEVG